MRACCFPSGKVLQCRPFYSYYFFFKTPSSNETEDLQNTNREIYISRKTAMPLKTGTHTHTQLLILLQNSKLCHPYSLCQMRQPSPLSQGCCWARDAGGTCREQRPFSFFQSLPQEHVWVPGSCGSIYQACGGLVYFQGFFYPKGMVADGLALPGPSHPHSTESDWLNTSYSSIVKIMRKIHPWHNSTEATGIKPEADAISYIIL